MRLRLALRAGLIACVALVSGGLGRPAQAQIGSDRYSAIVVESRTGAVLAAASPDETRHPASLTKMMTLYMVFEALREGRLTLESRIVMSEEAASRPPSKLGIPAGMSITVEQAILALVTRSANDVAAAVGERLGGSEYRFGQMMTMRARSIGMSRTTFRNASGLPDIEQVTTARDMATLGRRLLQDFPDRYHFFGVTQAQFGGIRIRNHNRMLESYEGVDGIKTGYIRDSGFNIVTSANRGGQRVVGAVFGGSSWVERDAHMASLLDQGFSQLGVASRDMRNAPTLVRTAQAAALPGRGAAAARDADRSPATRQQARRAPANRNTAQAAQASRTTTRARPAADTTRSTASRTAATTRSAAAAPQAASRQPARATGRGAATQPTPTRATTPSAAPPRPGTPVLTAPTLPPPRSTATIRTADLR
jgi:D-alanyl-D-alanine carboxypeptidase